MKNKLIPKHLKAGKLLKNEPVQDGTYVEQPRLNLQEQELLNFMQSNPTPEQVYFRDLAIKNGESPVLQEVLEEAEKDNAKNNFFRGYNNFRYSHPWAKGLNWTPVVGDIMDGISLVGDINNKDYTSAAVGLGLMALPNFILKPLQTGKNFIKLGKHFNKIGTGLTNPHIRKRFYNWARDPDFSLLFLNKYGDVDDISLQKAKQIQKDLDIIEDKYGVYPKDFHKWDVDNIIKDAQLGLQKADDLILEYNNKINYLEQNNPVLADIAKKSPLYLDLIYNDLTSNKILDTEKYVKDLITQANTFYRSMDTNNSDDFLYIRGINSRYGTTKKAMDVGTPDVVWPRLLYTRYGRYSRKYTPKQLNLSGDVSTWWDQRFPTFNDKNITLDNNGSYTDYYYPVDHFVEESNSTLPVRDLMRLYLKNNNIPSPYKLRNAHMTFLSDKDAYIGDFYNVTDNFDLKNDRYTLGFNQGGTIKFNPFNKFI